MISYSSASMRPKIRLLSTDFDGTLVSRVSEPVLDTGCMEQIRELQSQGAEAGHG